jgi:hypothetical protein
MDTPEAQPPTPSLGSRIELFTPSRANVYVGFVLGTLITVGGLGMAGCGLSQIPAVRAAPDEKAKDQAVTGVVGGLFVGAFLSLMGILGIWTAHSLVGTGVEVCENGLRWWPPGPESTVALWEDVARIEEQFVRDKVPMRLGGPLLSQTFREFEVICRDDRRFKFDRENISGIGRLGKRLRAIATAKAIAWVVVGTPD